jgi:hypothetical protein
MTTRRFRLNKLPERDKVTGKGEVKLMGATLTVDENAKVSDILQRLRKLEERDE